MKTTILAATLALSLAHGAEAAPITIQIQMADYSGRAAYLAGYVVDGQGAYVQTLFTSGGSDKYFKHLERWYRLFRKAGAGFDGMSGASIGSGEGKTLMIEMPDAFKNAGYVLRIESAVENQYDIPDEVEVPLDDASNGVAVSGKTYVGSVAVSF